MEIGNNQAFMESGWTLFALFMSEHGPLVNVEKSAKVLEGWIAYVSCLYTHVVLAQCDFCPVL